jgi:two-component system response regulator FixJ
LADAREDGTIMIRASKAMVIVVDDDDAIRASMRFLLESEGLEVQDYASAQALIAAAWPPAGAGCVILDIHMPEMDGLDLLERLRQTHSKVPVIMVTGQPTPANRNRALSAGALDVLEKPLNDGRFLELVHDALERNPRTAN